jgi:phosphatidylglycerophosphatase A
MIKKINILFLTIFAIGRSKYAPGTVASFVTSLIFIFFYIIQINILYLVVGVVLIFIYSVYSIDAYSNLFDQVDSREIVIDELVGQSIPLLTIFGLMQENNIDNFLLYTFIAFVVFRFFDIVKPYPINRVDKEMKNGFGVMLDDVIAGVYTSIFLLIVISFLYYD